MFTVGSILIWVSTRIGLDAERRGLSFLILGLIGMLCPYFEALVRVLPHTIVSVVILAFIPGSYATCQLYGAFKGWKGYDYSQIPSYDD